MLAGQSTSPVEAFVAMDLRWTTAGKPSVHASIPLVGLSLYDTRMHLPVYLFYLTHRNLCRSVALSLSLSHTIPPWYKLMSPPYTHT